ncbi:hypothetical protein [Rhodoferax sp.]|uniref:hypothetical protein n=1 Tax=Rhodoferax sp. TaxID=50421 RepID=UPI002605362A|nr:hypothetical protein [Rhodoferax sp.]MDD5480315.1 hypothetical protein [Rhodoferax sp.]
MKNWTLTLIGIASVAIFSVAHAAELDQAAKEDIARHRVMAVAHENAAKCLEAGKADEVCEKQLQLECKGVAIGKFCGMKHQH